MDGWMDEKWVELGGGDRPHVLILLGSFFEAIIFYPTDLEGFMGVIEYLVERRLT